jgi:CysZ protein
MTSNSHYSLHPMTVARAIRMSWESLRNPSVLIRIFIPFILVAFLCVGFISWGWPLIELEFIPFLSTYGFIQVIFGYLDSLLGFSLLTIFAIFLFILFTFIFMYFVYLILTSLLLVPLLNSVVQKKYFPDLAKNSELSFLTSVKNSVISIIIFISVMAILFPVLLIPGGQIVLPYFLNVYVTKRIFPFDVLQDYASRAEFERFRSKENRALWTLSFLCGGYFYVPILNFVAAPLSALAFIFFAMGKLQEYRR